jgi:PAS domain S-box-containing protein
MVMASTRTQAADLDDAAVLQMIPGGSPLSDVLGSLTRSIEARMGASCAIMIARHGVLSHAAAPTLPPDFVRAIDGNPIGEGATVCGTAASRRAHVIVDDIARDPLGGRHRDLALAHDLRAVWSFPIVGGLPGALGTLDLYHRKPCRPSAVEVKVASRAAAIAAIALERDRLDEALRVSEERARIIVDGALDANIELDHRGAVTSWSRRATEMFGWTRDEAIGRQLAELVIPASVRAQHERALRHYLQTGRRTMLGRRIEVVGAHRDGIELPLELTLTPMNLDGRVTFSAFVRDLSETRRVKQRLHDLEQTASLGQLSARIVHDFKGILSVTMVCGGLLKDRLQGEDLEIANEIVEAGVRGTQLVRQLLAHGRRQVRLPELVDLNQVIRLVESMLRRTIPGSIELALVLADELWPVQADPVQIEQIIINLAVNARDAMPRGGRLAIETSNVTIDARDHVRLTVSDTGSGMDADTSVRAFDAYFTTKQPGEGTGLGLAIVRDIVQQANGTISVKSHQYVGSTFEILLPRA